MRFMSSSSFQDSKRFSSFTHALKAELATRQRSAEASPEHSVRTFYLLTVETPNEQPLGASFELNKALNSSKEVVFPKFYFSVFQLFASKQTFEYLPDWSLLFSAKDQGHITNCPSMYLSLLYKLLLKR